MPSKGSVSHGHASRPVRIAENAGQVERQDSLIAEVPVELRYNGESFAVMMATPMDLEDFALGFSLSEGILADAAALRGIKVVEQLEGFVIEIDGELDRGIDAQNARQIPGRSGCGLCGSRRLEDVLRQWPAVPDSATIHPDALLQALAQLETRQPLNELTGAAHAAAWANRNGQVQIVREDVGRHNALDKLLGALSQKETDWQNGFVLVTSRASYEMVSKTLRFGVGMLAAISAPTALAVDLAEAGNLTLVAFVRPGRHVVYSHGWRLE